MKEKEQRVPIVGQIIEVSKHPNADRLYLATVDVGKGISVSIIFGGNRILRLGNLVAVALPGTRLPNGDKIRSRKYRGIRSGGEILSTDELGWTINGLDEVAILSPDQFEVGGNVR